MNNLRKPPAGFALALGAALLISACTLGPDFVRPKALDETHYNAGGDPSSTLAAGNVSQQFAQDMAIANWWELFHSAELNGVLQESFAHNPGVEAAKASLRAAEDNLQAGYGIYYPQVSAAANPARQRFSPERFGSATPASIFNLVTLSASVSYTLDVFGGERRLVENLGAQRDVQRAEVSGTYLALSGNIVNTAIALAAYRDEIALTGETLALLKEQIALTEKQAEAGTTAYSAVLALQNQLAQQEALLPPLKQKRDQADHLLATLAGRAPAQWKSPDLKLSDLTLPAKLPLSLPSELVRSRPDILAAESAMHAASANIGVAAAAQFPSFTLSGSYGQNAPSMNNLFGANANFWSIGANLATPVFDGGTLAAKKQAAADAYQQSAALYRQTVLAAFQQVADSIRGLQHDAEAQEADERALKAAGDALKLAQYNYQAGLSNYLTVLTNDIQYHQARLAYIEAEALRLQDTTAFFIALGGGFRDLP